MAAAVSGCAMGRCVTRINSLLSSNFQLLSASTRHLSEKSGRSSNFIKVGRFEKIHYEKSGDGEHVVLMIPGALGSTNTDLGPQLDKLNRDRFTWIALDPPGYGKSRPPAREWTDRFLHNDADLAAKFMKTVGYDRYSLLGWSDGGNVAMILAANNPESARSLVVWGSNSYVTQEELDMYKSIADIDKWSPRMRQGFIDEYGEDYFREHWRLWVDSVVAYYNNNNGNLFKESLPLIKCPTLIIHGDKDAMVPVFHPQYLHQHINNSRLIRWPDAKHNLHLRYPDEFNKEVENFFSEN